MVLDQVQVQVHLFTLIQYNKNKKKKELKTELTIHWIKHNKGKKCVAAKGAKLGGGYTVHIKHYLNEIIK